MIFFCINKITMTLIVWVIPFHYLGTIFFLLRYYLRWHGYGIWMTYYCIGIIFFLLRHYLWWHGYDHCHWNIPLSTLSNHIISSLLVILVNLHMIKSIIPWPIEISLELIEIGACGTIFFTYVLTWWWDSFFSEKLVFIKIGVVTYFIF